MEPNDPDAILERARRLRPDFEARVADVPYEHKGVLFSEMLFLRAAVGERAPARIVESGRMRGQSTALLGLLFPGSEVHSVEWQSGTPEAAVAEARLADMANVTLHYGDSNELFPRLVRPGDVAFIDGPKGHRAMSLALDCLRLWGASMVFVHDCHRGSFERRFLEPGFREARFSDEARFVEAHRDLDEPCWRTCDEQGLESWRPHHYEGRTQESYGPTVAFVPRNPAAPYWRHRARLRLMRMGRRLQRLGQKARRLPAGQAR